MCREKKHLQPKMSQVALLPSGLEAPILKSEIANPQALIRGSIRSIRVRGESAANFLVAGAGQDVIMAGAAVHHMQVLSYQVALVDSIGLQLRIGALFTEPSNIRELER